MWSKKFNCCINCFRKDIKHEAHGLCKRCYDLNRDRSNRKKPKNSKWAKDHDFCVICKTTNHPHHGKGMCTYCRNRSPEYLRYVCIYEARPEVIKRRKEYKRNNEGYRLSEARRLKIFRENNKELTKYYNLKSHLPMDVEKIKKEIELLKRVRTICSNR